MSVGSTPMQRLAANTNSESRFAGEWSNDARRGFNDLFEDRCRGFVPLSMSGMGPANVPERFVPERCTYRLKSWPTNAFYCGLRAPAGDGLRRTFGRPFPNQICFADVRCIVHRLVRIV